MLDQAIVLSSKIATQAPKMRSVARMARMQAKKVASKRLSFFHGDDNLFVDIDVDVAS